nr:elicitin-like protein [Pythium porphyrae]QYE52127.1 elicitin-like protein [Pythium porphyrae]
MQFTTVLAAIVAIATAASVDAYEQTKQCSFLEYFKLAPLANNPNLPVCQNASGWTMIPPAGYPTPTQRAIMCKTPECFKLIDAVKATKPNDCILVFGDVKLNVKQLVEEFEPSCYA